jgi:hypothetical protein
MPNTRPLKSHYSESEAAASLGVSVDELRHMVRLHIVSDEEDITKLPITTFQPSDLLILRLLSGARVA